MARILIICDRYPADRPSGRYLRMYHLCLQLLQANECFLIDFGGGQTNPGPDNRLNFTGRRSLATVPTEGRAFSRHFRFSNAHFLRRSSPEYLRTTVVEIECLCQQWRIDLIFSFVAGLAEVVLPINVPKILDYCDCDTLTTERVLANRRWHLPLSEYASLRLKLLRQMRRERHLLRQFNQTTTISNPDRACLLKVSGVPDNRVSVIPNGVSNAALTAGKHSRARNRTVVFWGNLDFPPNWTAVHYFHDQIYLPHLADRNIDWHVIGGGASDAINKMADHPKIHVHGYVDELFDIVSAHGVMVNPMIEGSGLKNKVLEAFACGVPVVSSPMGIEAVGAVPDRHYIAADSPKEFAQSVIRLLDDADCANRMRSSAREFVAQNFDWTMIGKRLNEVIQSVLSNYEQRRVPA